MLTITPILHPLNAAVRVPGSKSLTNRALVIAALADGTTRLTNTLFSDDSLYLVKALQTLGFDLTLDETNHMMQITGLGGIIPSHQADLFIGNAGTAARFLCAFLTLGSGKYVLDGAPRMRQRPIRDLMDALTLLGAKVDPLVTTGERPRTMEDRPFPTTRHQACLPVRITASGLPGGKTSLAGDVSSQFLSALLMVAPYAHSPIKIAVSTKVNSKPYIDMTLAIMQDFGIEIQRDGYSHFIIPLGHYSPSRNYLIESDASAASYFFAAAALCGGSVRVENISRNSKQGDIGFLEVLRQMGCSVVDTEYCIQVLGAAVLHGIDVDMSDIPDTAQTLAVIAPFAAEPTRIRGIASARLKETDRVAATCAELGRLGVRVDEHPDGFTIYPCSEFNAAVIQTYQDHRMAMSFALIGLRLPGVSIENPDCVTKTFPNFFDVLETLR
jgi:3-phosphoshikimate 1-carboxyvinyltransferase